MLRFYLIISIILVLCVIYYMCMYENYINMMYSGVYPFDWNYMGIGYPSIFDPRFSVPFAVDEPILD